MLGVIIAGGKGMRMRNYGVPKALLEIGGKTIIERQIDQLKKAGINKIIICTGYMGDSIQAHLGNGKKCKVSIKYSHEHEPLGTGGALKNAEKLISDSFVLLYGDTAFDFDIRKMIDFHKSKKAFITVLVHKTSHPEDSDIIEMDANQRITTLHKKPHKTKPQSDISKSSIYVAEKDVLDALPKGKSDFVDVLLSIINKGKAYGYMTDEFVMDIGTPERYEKVKKSFESIIVKQ